MDDPLPPDLQAVLDHAWQSAQRLAIDVIGYTPEQRDEVMRNMGASFAKVAREAGCTHELASEFGEAMERAIRDYVAEIEARGGGTAGTA